MILVDTTVWIPFLTQTESPFAAGLERFIDGEADIAPADIILMEILQGVREDKRIGEVREYLLEFPVYRAKKIGSYIHAARIYGARRTSRKTEALVSNNKTP